MADTAIRTADYANGQTVLATIKAKEIGFDRSGLEEEIASILEDQSYCCALTGYLFHPPSKNPHLKPRLRTH
jgi:hypothetical protein